MQIRLLAAPWLVIWLVLAACAGRSSRSSTTQGNSAGSSATAGDLAAGGSLAPGGNGGSVSNGGNISSGGNISNGGNISSGGSISSSGSISGGGAAGEAGASALPRCLEPIVMGSCQAYLPRYAFNPESLSCEMFVYGGCGGNDNRFDTLETCQAACVATLPAGCDNASGSRPLGCPCVASSQCACSGASYETYGAPCAAESVGYCVGFGEGKCMCTLSGNIVCGV